LLAVGRGENQLFAPAIQGEDAGGLGLEHARGSLGDLRQHGVQIKRGIDQPAGLDNAVSDWWIMCRRGSHRCGAVGMA